jgi:hypothetical protein
MPRLDFLISRKKENEMWQNENFAWTKKVKNLLSLHFTVLRERLYDHFTFIVIEHSFLTDHYAILYTKKFLNINDEHQSK